MNASDWFGYPNHYICNSLSKTCHATNFGWASIMKNLPFQLRKDGFNHEKESIERLV